MLNVIKLMKEHHHIHTEACGHMKLRHAGHYDYIVDGYLHHQHGNHCDLHGYLELAQKTPKEVKSYYENYSI